MRVLSGAEWRARAAAHVARVEPWVRPHLERASRHERHPVHDFLFRYYSFRPSRLQRWSPGPGVSLEDAAEWAADPVFECAEGCARLRELPDARRDGVAWALHLLESTAARPPAHACFGLHEWAMVYRTEAVRHAAWPLRLGPDDVARVVERAGVNCTHHDAFRFFTPAARPLNRTAPTREDQAATDQPGCIHVTMDLYKWAYKLAPWVESELVADCFELACAAREVDMRASPYELRALGYEPIEIETEAGRVEYQARQRELAERAIPLRARLIAAHRAALGAAACRSAGGAA
jgi:hypothetical protein